MIDRIRQLYPHLSIGVYALEPGGDVIVEVFAPDGTRFSRTSRTADEAFAAIFGPLPEEESAPEPTIDPFD